MSEKSSTAYTQELDRLMRRFITQEVQPFGDLSDVMKELSALAALAVQEDRAGIAAHTSAALACGASPEQIGEAVLHCTPYIGCSRVRMALEAVEQAFEKADVHPAEPMARTDEATRFEAGLQVQREIFGAQQIDGMRASAPENQRHIQDYLSDMCFGDFYTRGGLNVRERELITFCALAALGGCENQLRAHIAANASVGNEKNTMIAALTQCLPYIGFPRTLNALACLNEVLPENQQA